MLTPSMPGFHDLPPFVAAGPPAATAASAPPLAAPGLKLAFSEPH